MADRGTDRVARASPAPHAAIAMSGLLLWLGGCASVQSVSSPATGVDIPAAWSVNPDPSRTQGSSLAQWWSRFGDPTLEVLVTDALESNRSVQSAKAAPLDCNPIHG
jgi:hypothetical protein